MKPPKNFILLLALTTSVLLGFAGCSAAEGSQAVRPINRVVFLKPSVISKIPHDPQAFTQGLLLHNDRFYESTGIYGKSSLRTVDSSSGKVLGLVELPRDYFGEGLALWDGKLVQLTWKRGQAFVYPESVLGDGSVEFAPETRVYYSGEGWGLTSDESNLIMSNGSSTITFRDPITFEKRRDISVVQDSALVEQLNELEYVNGQIYANIWRTDQIVQIDPASGKVTARIDCSGLLSDKERAAGAGVLNGIAYDAESERLFVTGKNWPWVFEVSFEAESEEKGH